jgi:hypothetical protein
VLNDFLLDNLECSTSAMNYYSKLRWMTSSMFPHLVLVMLYLRHFKDITLTKHVARIDTERSWESLDSGGSWRPWSQSDFPCCLGNVIPTLKGMSWLSDEWFQFLQDDLLKALSDCCACNHSLNVGSTMLLVRQNVGSCCT